VTSVLVVDDDFMVARLNARFVERTDGFQVVGVAANGAEALEMATRLDPDLVLLDVHLPDVDGLEVLARLREAGSRAGVVMVTAERDADVVRSALAGGAMQYVVKPFEQPDLAERLHRVRNALAALGDGEADQDAIDRAFGAARSSSRATPLPKGLSRETARLVEELLAGTDDDVSASDAADRLGLSRVTARRYLEHFVGTGEAQVRLRYGGAGRPERRYRRP
jgi:response regulator of citrate/malate metabolism